MGASVGDPALGLFRRPALASIDAAPTIPESIGDPTVFGPYLAAVGEGLLRLLTGAAARPVAVISDLQWADPDTLAVVEYIAGHINGLPTALVVMHRPGENADADAVIGRLGRNSWATCLDLAALARDAVHEMIRVRLQGGRPRRSWSRRSPGSPRGCRCWSRSSSPPPSRTTRCGRAATGTGSTPRRAGPVHRNRCGTRSRRGWVASAASAGGRCWPAPCWAGPSMSAWSPAACTLTGPRSPKPCGARPAPA